MTEVDLLPGVALEPHVELPLLLARAREVVDELLERREGRLGLADVDRPPALLDAEERALADAIPDRSRLQTADLLRLLRQRAAGLSSPAT